MKVNAGWGCTVAIHVVLDLMNNQAKLFIWPTPEVRTEKLCNTGAEAVLQGFLGQWLQALECAHISQTAWQDGLELGHW